MQRILITLAMTILVAATVAVGATSRANASSTPQPAERDSGVSSGAMDSGASHVGAWDSGAASNYDM